MGILALAAPFIAQGIGAGLGMLNQGAQDKRYLRNAEKLQDLQIKGGKEMADYNKANQLDIWNKTNYEAQKEHIKGAGLNAALMYGQGGAGGATTGSGGGAMPSGGTPQGGDAGAMGLMQMSQMAAQTKLLNAQAEKTTAEAEKAKGVDTEAGKQQISESQSRQAAIEFQNSVNKAIGADRIARNYETAADKLHYEQQREMAEYNAWQAAGFEGKSTDDPSSPVAKAIKAGLSQTITNLENAKKDGNIKDAELQIKQLEGRLAEEGIPAGSPWYIKIMGDLLNKVGIINSK